MGDRTYQVSEAYLIGQALEAQGRVDQAEEWLATEPLLEARSQRTKASWRHGSWPAAGSWTRPRPSPAPHSRARGEPPVPLFADPGFTLAEILVAQGRTGEARVEAEACLRRYEAKGIPPLAERARALLAGQSR